jgi:hypothetical protein
VTIAARLNQLTHDQETERRAGEFLHFCRALMLENGSPFRALHRAQENHASERVITCLRAAAAVGSTTEASWAEPLSEYQQIAGGFLSGLYNAGCFDRLLPDMSQMPLHVQVTAVTQVASGSVVPEFSSKPLTKLTAVNGQLQEKKAIAQFVTTAELLRAGGPEIISLMRRELVNATALATDQGFLAILTAGVTAIPSSGATALAVRADLRGLLASLKNDKSSRLFMIARP